MTLFMFYTDLFNGLQWLILLFNNDLSNVYNQIVIYTCFTYPFIMYSMLGTVYILWTVSCVQYDMYCTVFYVQYIILWSVCSVQCTVCCTLHFTPQWLCRWGYCVHCTLYSMYCTVQYAVYSVYVYLYTPLHGDGAGEDEILSHGHMLTRGLVDIRRRNVAEKWGKSYATKQNKIGIIIFI